MGWLITNSFLNLPRLETLLLTNFTISELSNGNMQDRKYENNYASLLLPRYVVLCTPLTPYTTHSNGTHGTRWNAAHMQLHADLPLQHFRS